MFETDEHHLITVGDVFHDNRDTNSRVMSIPAVSLTGLKHYTVSDTSVNKQSQSDYTASSKVAFASKGLSKQRSRLTHSIHEDGFRTTGPNRHMLYGPEYGKHLNTYEWQQTNKTKNLSRRVNSNI